MRILYVEDSINDAELLKSRFQQSALSSHLDWVTTLNDAREKLADLHPDNSYYDMLLTKLELPDGSGASLIPFIYENGLPVAIVIITDGRSDERGIEALNAGAADYVIKKDHYLDRLPAVLASALTRYRSEQALTGRPLRVLCGINADEESVLTQNKLLHAPVLVFDVATTTEELLHKLSSPHDVCLLDYRLSDGDGLNLLKDLLEAIDLDLPIVLLVKEGDEQVGRQALRLGAIDYAVKNITCNEQIPWILSNAVHKARSRRESEALKASEEHFRALVENIDDMIITIDHTHTATYVSPSVTRVLGYHSEECISLGEASILHPEDVEITRNLVDESLLYLRTTTKPVIVRLRHQNGEWRSFELVGKGLIDRSGKPLCVITTRDVTDRLHMEEKLRESEELYRTFIDSTSDVAFLKNDQFRYIMVNKKFKETRGMSDKDVIGKTDFELPMGERADLLRQQDIHILQSLTPDHFNFTVSDKVFEAVKFPVRLGGDKIGIGSFVRDVTEQVQTEQRIRSSEQFLHAILAASPIGIGKVRDRVIEWVSDSLQTLMGYRPEDLVGKSASCLYESIEEYNRVEKELYQEGRTETRLVRKDGAVRDCLLLVSPTDSFSHIFTITDVTDQKEAENALRQHEERFRMLIEKSNEVYMLINDNGAHFYISPALTAILGYTPEEYSAFSLPEMFHPDDFSTVERIIAETQANKFRSSSGVLRRKHKNGTYRWTEDITRNMLSDPNVRAVVVNFHDVTDRIEMEEQLRERQELYRIIAENASDVIWLINMQGNPKYVSPSVTNLLGYTPEEIKQMPLEDLFVRDEHLQSILDDRLKVLKGLHPATNRFEAEHIRKDGSTVWVEAKGKELRNDAGEMIGYLIAIRDISDRKGAEAALRESEAKYRTLVENDVVGVYIVQDDKIRFANHKWLEIHGYTYEETVDKLGAEDFISPDEKQRIEEERKQTHLENRPNKEQTVKVVRKDKTVISARTVLGSIMYNGRPAILGTVIDVTREATLESQLRQAQKMEAIGTLAGGIAHDFNNILTVLSGYGTLLKMGIEENDPMRMYVEQILAASHKAAGLTQSLLAFSRQQTITLVPINLNDLVKVTEKLLKRLLTEDIAFKTLLTETPLTVLADPVQIDQILFNLATNSRDAMPGGGSLTIETNVLDVDEEFVRFHSLGKPGEYAVLSISDSGTGMDAATKEKIFEPFFTTKVVGKGTGLGLSTVYGVVKQHNGHISVYSEQGMGTTFRVYLPLVEAASEKEERVANEIRGGSETVLVAEDNAEVRKLVLNILTAYEYKVIEAVDGMDAVEKFTQSSSVDLLILDSVMPRKNGRQAYDDIIKIAPETKVLFTSGYTRDVILDKGVEMGQFDFISKPLVPTKLLRKVREILDR